MEELIELHHDDGYPAGFTLIDNRDIWTGLGRDRKTVLRPVALGVYVAMYSLPKGWVFRESWLIEHLDVGRDALRRVLAELEEAKRLRRRRNKDDKGRYVQTIWTLLRAGTPRTDFPSMAQASPRPENPSVDVAPPQPGFPAPANPTAGKPVALVSKEEAKNTEKATTTAQPLPGAGDLVWPSQLNQKQVVVIWQKFESEGLAVDLRQDVLDEFEGRYRIGNPPRQPMSWLPKTIEKAAKGHFVLDAGLVIQAERRQRQAAEAAERQRGIDRAAADAKRNDPEHRARQDAFARKAAEEINGKGSSPHAFASP